MHPLSLAEYLQAAASAMAAGRLLQFGSGKGQPALLTFLAFTSVYLVILASADPVSNIYFGIYLVGTVVNWVVGIFAVREMLALAFGSYPGIRSVGRWVLYAAMGLAVGVSALIAFVFPHTGGHGVSLLNWAEILNRSVVSAMAAVIVAILIFLSRYPLRLSRNTRVSTIFFSAVFLSEALMLAVDVPSAFLFRKWVDVTQVAFAAVCFLGWAVLLRPEPAQAPARRISFENPAEHELLRQLDSLNQLLSRAGRR